MNAAAAPTLAALCCALLTAGMIRAGEWTYDGFERLTHAETGWTLRVVANGKDLTVTGPHAPPLASPAALPLGDAVADGYRVTAIGRHSFPTFPILTDIALPGTLTRIGFCAFTGNPSLTNITVAADNPVYRDIGGVLFSKDGLELIQFPGGRAGAYVIPAGTARIGTQAFARCRKLTRVTIPDSLTRIDPNAFAGCSGLTRVTIPVGVTDICDNVFTACGNMTKITVAAKNPAYRSIGGAVFSKDGTRLAIYPSGKAGAYAIPAGVTRIETSAFACCVGLTSLAIPASVSDINGSAFANCVSLARITVAEDNPAYSSADGALFTKDGTQLIRYPAMKGLGVRPPRHRQ